MYERDEQDDGRLFKVVMNHEEQYSIWAKDRENPPGWTDAGPSGTRAECLAYIEKVWTDLTPLSVRQALEAQRAAS